MEVREITSFVRDSSRSRKLCFDFDSTSFCFSDQFQFCAGITGRADDGNFLCFHMPFYLTQKRRNAEKKMAPRWSSRFSVPLGQAKA
jgi:hypothetical protein